MEYYPMRRQLYVQDMVHVFPQIFAAANRDTLLKGARHHFVLADLRMIQMSALEMVIAFLPTAVLVLMDILLKIARLIHVLVLQQMKLR